jgi:hypothetical protein
MTFTKNQIVTGKACGTFRVVGWKEIEKFGNECNIILRLKEINPATGEEGRGFVRLPADCVEA